MGRVGAAGLPAPAIDALVEAESITTLAAQGASWLADASVALSGSAGGATAPGGSAIAVGVAGATASQLAAIAAPFMDMGDRHVQRTAAALASVAATVAQAVDTLLADGTVDLDDMEQEEGDGGAKYLVYPSDWTNLLAIQQALVAVDDTWDAVVAAGHPMVVDTSTAQSLPTIVQTAMTALQSINNASQHEPLCVNNITWINQTVFVTDEATGGKRSLAGR